MIDYDTYIEVDDEYGYREHMRNIHAFAERYKYGWPEASWRIAALNNAARGYALPGQTVDPVTVFKHILTHQDGKDTVKYHGKDLTLDQFVAAWNLPRKMLVIDTYAGD